MSKCYDFTVGARGKMHEFSDGKAMFDLCDEMREAGKRGFLVRAESAKEARKRLDSLPPVHKNVETVFIL